MSDLFSVDEASIRREKAKARQLRKTRWWQRKLAASTCYYCGRHVPASTLTMDHVVPLSRGGKSTKNNLVAACKECNNRKKDSLVFEWTEHLER